MLATYTHASGRYSSQLPLPPTINTDGGQVSISGCRPNAEGCSPPMVTSRSGPLMHLGETSVDLGRCALGVNHHLRTLRRQAISKTATRAI
jgi:hypothetical protein